ncbi:MAG: hypothetical protein AB7E77_09725 [Desulfobulbus sp.]
MNTTDLWEMLGDLEEGQSLEVLTQLFVRYEQRFRQNPQDPESSAFFRHLAAILAQVQSCNLNRR